MRRLRGRPPFGGTGVRYYSTTRRTVEATDAWREESVHRRHADKIDKKQRAQVRYAVQKATYLRRYWSQFPTDDEIQKQAAAAQARLKVDGTLYAAMTLDRRLLFGVAAPKHTIKGTTSTANTFRQDIGVVKVDMKRFRRMKQRGEILTGGPHLHGALHEHRRDWTGVEW